jgi:hypothetical protein
MTGLPKTAPSLMIENSLADTNFGRHKFGRHKFGRPSVWLTPNWLTYIWLTDTWPTHIWPTHNWLARICLTNIWLTNIWQTYIWPTNIWQTYIWPTHSWSIIWPTHIWLTQLTNMADTVFGRHIRDNFISSTLIQPTQMCLRSIGRQDCYSVDQMSVGQMLFGQKTRLSQKPLQGPVL